MTHVKAASFPTVLAQGGAGWGGRGDSSPRLATGMFHAKRPHVQQEKLEEGVFFLSFFPYVALIFFFFLNTFIYNETVHHCETAPEVIALLLDFSLGASKKDEFGKTHYRAQHEDKECDVNKFKQQRRRLFKRIPEWLRLEQISGDCLLIQPLPMIHCIFINVWKLEV